MWAAAGFIFEGDAVLIPLLPVWIRHCHWEACLGVGAQQCNGSIASLGLALELPRLAWPARPCCWPRVCPGGGGREGRGLWLALKPEVGIGSVSSGEESIS